MLSFLPGPVTGVLALFLLLINILVVPSFVIFFGMIRAIVPIESWRQHLTHFINNSLPSLWVDLNGAILWLCTNIKWDVKGEGELRNDHWYFVIANHQSWADILVMQKVFNRQIPILKFFLKQELLWVLPLGGLACWMLDFPFMKRHSMAYLKKHPEQRSKDYETTLQACEKFKILPTSVINYLEGTRFTEEKRVSRSSPYKHLLRPKAGGLALVVHALQDYIKEMIDVTIVYDYKEPSFWDFISGKVKNVTVRYQVKAIPDHFRGDYYKDSEFRKKFQGWVNVLWQEKDQQIDRILEDKTNATKKANHCYP